LSSQVNLNSSIQPRILIFYGFSPGGPRETIPYQSLKSFIVSLAFVSGAVKIWKFEMKLSDFLSELFPDLSNTYGNIRE